MSTARDAMYAAFELAPGDFAGYGAMGDELESLGYPRLAHAFRWMWKRERFPHRRSHFCDRLSRQGRKVPQKWAWAWYNPLPRFGRWTATSVWPGVLPKAVGFANTLPRELLRRPQALFPSHQAAVMWLADRLSELRAVCEIEPPRPAGLPLIQTLDDVCEIRVPPLLKPEGQGTT